MVEDNICDIESVVGYEKCNERATKTLRKVVIPDLCVSINLCESHYEEIKKYANRPITFNIKGDMASRDPKDVKTLFTDVKDGSEILT